MNEKKSKSKDKDKKEIKEEEVEKEKKKDKEDKSEKSEKSKDKKDKSSDKSKGRRKSDKDEKKSKKKEKELFLEEEREVNQQILSDVNINNPYNYETKKSILNNTERCDGCYDREAQCFCLNCEKIYCKLCEDQIHIVPNNRLHER
jgi:hypothetical protein